MDLMANNIGISKFMLFICVMFLSYISYFSGGLYAKTQSDFVVAKEGDEFVALKKYNEDFWVAKFNRSEKKVYAEYKLIPIGASLGMFNFERIGPLSPAGMDADKKPAQ